jgi:DNA repair exonuclease SbcCD nuclease subunit
MITLVWRTDAHLADEAPASRTDDWMETILGKFRQVGEIARSVDADAVIDGGDLTHIKSPIRNSHHMVRRIAEVHADYPCPVYCCIGNHDVKYGDYAYLGESPLGVLFETRVFRRLYDQHEALFEDGPYKVRVVGIPYHGTKYDPNRINTITKGKETHLMVVGHLLASAGGGSMFEGEDILKYSDLANLDPDLWAFGHWHKDQGVQTVGGKTFINIGSLSRGSLSLDDLTRQPGVAIIRFEGKKMSVEVQRLQVESAEKVFDLDKRVRAEVRDMTMDAFVDSIKDTLKGRTEDSLFTKLDLLKNVPPEVHERAISYLEKVGAR